MIGPVHWVVDWGFGRLACQPTNWSCAEDGGPFVKGGRRHIGPSSVFPLPLSVQTCSPACAAAAAALPAAAPRAAAAPPAASRPLLWVQGQLPLAA